jgi:putative membrane protein
MGFDLSILPTVDAFLNTTSAVLLGLGYYFIRRRNIRAHKTCMIAAVGTSTLFLACYLTYHYFHGTTRFTGQGTVRTVYLTILGTHTVVAVAVVPLVILTLHRAFRARFDLHKRIARWTLPIWLYVSITGVIVYWMLYHLHPVPR